MDEDGYVYIMGCVLDMYILGGFNIYLCEIEEKFLIYLVVFEVVIFGMLDEVWGEIGVVVVVLEVE